MHTTQLTQFYYACRMSLKCPSLYTYVTYKWFQIVIWFHIERVSVPKTYTRHHCIMSSSNLKLKCHIYALYTFYMTLIQWFHIKGKWTVNFQSLTSEGCQNSGLFNPAKFQNSWTLACFIFYIVLFCKSKKIHIYLNIFLLFFKNRKKIDKSYLMYKLLTHNFLN